MVGVATIVARGDYGGESREQVQSHPEERSDEGSLSRSKLPLTHSNRIRRSSAYDFSTDWTNVTNLPDKSAKCKA